MAHMTPGGPVNFALHTLKAQLNKGTTAMCGVLRKTRRSSGLRAASPRFAQLHYEKKERTTKKSRYGAKTPPQTRKHPPKTRNAKTHPKHAKSTLPSHHSRQCWFARLRRE